jgi:hypothetical protein
VEDLVQWLRAQLDEDEQTAREASNRRWLVQDNIIELYPEREDDGFMSWPTRSDARHAANWEPARVLREIDAKRQILGRYEELRADKSGIGDVEEEYQYFLLRLLAAVYEDRPGWRKEWRP